VRKSCQVFIYIDVAAAMAGASRACVASPVAESGGRTDGLDFFVSPNGVILTQGNADRVLLPRYFSRVVDRQDRPMPVPAAAS
jgi:hypothetical protein